MNNFIENVVMSLLIFVIVIALIAGSAITLVIGAIAAIYALVVLIAMQKEFWYFMATIVLVYGVIKLI